MLNFKFYLQESLDSPYPFKQETKWSYAFFNKDRREYIVWFEESGYGGIDGYSLLFGMMTGKGLHNNKYITYSTTGKGDEFKIYSTVLAILFDFARKEKPKIIVIDTNNELNRLSLYEKLIKKYIKLYSNYNYVVETSNNRFIIYNKKYENELKDVLNESTNYQIQSKYLYHITTEDNLQQILDSGKLLPPHHTKAYINFPGFGKLSNGRLHFTNDPWLWINHLDGSEVRENQGLSVFRLSKEKAQKYKWKPALFDKNYQTRLEDDIITTNAISIKDLDILNLKGQWKTAINAKGVEYFQPEDIPNFRTKSIKQ